MHKGIAPLREGDQEALLEFGIAFAMCQCTEMLQAGAPGLHFCTMDRGKSSAEIIPRLMDGGLL